MTPSFRKATVNDAARMFDIRKHSILELAPRGMSVPQSEEWASRLTPDVMIQRFGIAEFWIAEVDSVIVGWVGIRGNEIYGLYVDPQFVNKGIGSRLLRLAEEIMLAKGFTKAWLDASWNAEAFYSQQGYTPIGPRPPDETRMFVRQLRDVVQSARSNHPTIVMLAGLPGTGKTSLAYAIAQVFSCVVLDKDRINTTLINAGLKQDAAGPMSYDVLLDLVEDMVAIQKHSVIIDTAGRQRVVLDRARTIAEQAGAALRVIRLIAPRTIRLSRMSSRESRASQWLEDDTTESEEAQWYRHLPPDTLIISSTVSLKELLPNVLDFICDEGNGT
jgi:predicted kinase/GNAT superfamily N-acetyltransferase